MSDVGDPIKATEEVAKTAGKAIDAAREAGGFVSRLLGGSLEQITGAIEDGLKYWRAGRLLDLERRWQRKLLDRGIPSPTTDLSPSFVIPLLQAASLEDDEVLRDRWAELLANVSDADAGVEQRRAFVSILEEIGPLEVSILDLIYRIPEGEQASGIKTARLPEEAFALAKPGDPGRRSPPRHVEIALGNLVRLGCLTGAGTYGGGSTLRLVFQTALGRAFVEACSPRRAGAQKVETAGSGGAK